MSKPKSPSPRQRVKRRASAPRKASSQNAANGDWRTAALARIRRLIERAVPGVVEEVKWRKPSNPAGVPVWSHGGILCTGETYATHVKVTFPKGARLEDPARLFNQRGATRCAIDLREGDALDERAFEALVRAAAEIDPPKTGR